MGKRGEVFSTRYNKGGKTYFFNVKENIYGESILNIVESKSGEDDGKFIRQSVLVFEEDIPSFVSELQKALDFIKIRNRNKPKSTRLQELED